MNEGDIVVAALRQADGTSKARPAPFLMQMPPFQDLLVCGISTQLQHMVPGLDESILPTDADFKASGLKAGSIIRLGYLAVLPRNMISGRIGSIPSQRLGRILTRLADFIRPQP